MRKFYCIIFAAVASRFLASMSSVKNRKKQSKGSGAASRYDKKFDDSIKAQESKSNGDADPAGDAARAKRKARKELEAATVRDLNWVNTLINRLQVVCC